MDIECRKARRIDLIFFIPVHLMRNLYKRTPETLVFAPPKNNNLDDFSHATPCFHATFSSLLFAKKTAKHFLSHTPKIKILNSFCAWIHADCGKNRRHSELINPFHCEPEKNPAAVRLYLSRVDKSCSGLNAAAATTVERDLVRNPGFTLLYLYYSRWLFYRFKKWKKLQLYNGVLKETTSGGG